MLIWPTVLLIPLLQTTEACWHSIRCKLLHTHYPTIYLSLQGRQSVSWLWRWRVALCLVQGKCNSCGLYLVMPCNSRVMLPTFGSWFTQWAAGTNRVYFKPIKMPAVRRSLDHSAGFELCLCHGCWLVYSASRQSVATFRSALQC